jgi:type II secretory pathway pseudopilin PulG
MHTVRRAITLIEVLILTVIVAIVVGTIVPEFTATKIDAKMSNLKYNLHMVRTQLEKYREQHRGEYPRAGTGDELRLLMTQPTTADGHSSIQKTTSTNPRNGIQPKLGPYLDNDLPENPFKGNSQVVIVSGDSEPQSATAGVEAWQYNPRHGWFYPNCDEYFKARSSFTPQN